MYGMAFEFLFEFLHGCHVFYLNRIPSPAIIAQALQEVKPVIVIAVPLIIEKIVRKKVFPKIQNNRMRLLLQMPVISKKVREMICQEVLKAFGGRMYEVIIGGAALNQEVEQFLKRMQRSAHRLSVTETGTPSPLAHVDGQPCTRRWRLTLPILVAFPVRSSLRDLT